MNIKALPPIPEPPMNKQLAIAALAVVAILIASMALGKKK